MDMQVICSFGSGELVFTSKKLQAATDKIVKKMSTSKSAFAAAGAELEKIKNEKLWEQDFESFSDYVGNVFNISQAKAYKIISTAKKLIKPELDGECPANFLNYSESALAALIAAGDTHEDIEQFCERNNITEFTPVAEIRAALKSEKEDSKCEEMPAEVETTAESADEKNADNAPENVLNELIVFAEFFACGNYDEIAKKDKEMYKKRLTKAIKAVREEYNI